jgi:predicted porin
VAGAQSVQVYGKFYPYVEKESGSGASAVGTAVSTLSPAATGVNTVVSTNGMSAGNSNIGIKGREPLGGGLTAEFQIEGVVAVDTGSATGFLWNRNGFVGLEGGFGEVRLGFFDTVFKEYGDTLGILGISSGTPVSSSNILRKIGFGTSNNARFHERRPNAIAFESREMNGFQFGALMASNEVSLTPNAALGAAKTYSFGVKYDSEGWYFGLAHEIHDNWFGGSAQAPSSQRNNGAADNLKSRDQATQATVEWRINKQNKISFDAIRKDYDEKAITNGRFQSYTNMAYQIAFESRLTDQWRLGGHYVRSQAGTCARINAACSTDGLEGSKLMFGAGYYFSRRTNLFAVYNQLTNGKSARFSAASEFGANNPGEDMKQYILGIAHSF